MASGLVLHNHVSQDKIPNPVSFYLLMAFNELFSLGKIFPVSLAQKPSFHYSPSIQNQLALFLLTPGTHDLHHSCGPYFLAHVVNYLFMCSCLALTWL